MTPDQAVHGLPAPRHPVGTPGFATDGAAIETNELTKRYGGQLAVDRLNLRVERGEIFGFLGPNGAGKTTTMRMLLGLIRPTSGRAEILGMDIATHLPAILARTGSTIEDPTFYPYLSGRDNLRVVARLANVSEGRIPAILDLVDLTETGKKRYKAFSLGMKQRLAVGAALLSDPDVLILDEPANGLDPAGIVEMRDLMKRLKAEGKTVLISSHVLREIEQICDRIAILNHGRVAVQGRVDDLLRTNDKIEIRIDRAREAAWVLDSVPWILDIELDGDRLVLEAPLDRAAEINALLAEHLLFASGIRPREESLEQYFLDVTEGDAA